MELNSPQKETYATDSLSAVQAQRMAQEIAFAPVVFQVSRLMLKFGILEVISEATNGINMAGIVEKTKLPQYAVQCLLESSLTIGTVLCKDNSFFISKAGWFLLNDPMARVNLDFVHDVNYLGLFKLEESLMNGKPEGLKTFGNWNTIYEGLSHLPSQAQESWFKFDHFYSDNSFSEALQIVFSRKPKTLLDVGGNTGRWALQCVKYDDDINVTIMDLPQQLQMMRQQTKNSQGAERIFEHSANVLDQNVTFPTNFDAIWMSQFLDCFSEEEITSILCRAAKSMNRHTVLYIMETLWDRQKFETASYCLTQITLYFTCMANGNSKMYNSTDLLRCVDNAGLVVETIHDGLGKGHSLLVCKKKI